MGFEIRFHLKSPVRVFKGETGDDYYLKELVAYSLSDFSLIEKDGECYVLHRNFAMPFIITDKIDDIKDKCNKLIDNYKAEMEQYRLDLLQSVLDGN